VNTETEHHTTRQERLILNPSFWSIVSIFVLITLHHYNDQTNLILLTIPDTYFGITRHTVDRILYLVPIILSSFIFGLKGGAAAIIIALLFMLPRAIFISPTPSTAIIETIMITLIGSVAPISANTLRKRSEQLEQARACFESSQRKLQSKVRMSIKQEKQLTVINAFTEMLSRSLDIEIVLNNAIKMIMEVMHVDIVLIFSRNRNEQELNLIAFKGIKERSAQALDGMKLGEGLCGCVADSGKPILVEDIANNPDFYTETAREEGLHTQLSVPLMARDKIMGTLCIATCNKRRFQEAEIELLSALGNLVGIAIDNSGLYHERELANEQLRFSERKYRQLFENAHDAIWIQNLNGKITDANIAAANLLGFRLSELIGADSHRFLPQESLTVSETIQDNLLDDKTDKQPYTQKLIRKDGTEAILKVTTNLISSNGHPDGFQFIGRDITKEVRLQENQHFYLRQITKGHEEERLRISRDLHDSTAQNLIAALHQLEEFCQASKELPMAKLRFLWGLHDHLKDSLQKVRRLSRDLRPSIIDDLGLIPAVEWLTEQLKTEHKISASLTVSGEERRFSPEVEVALFRIAQEALRNVAKHAAATSAELSIGFDDTATKLVIADNGKGFELPVSIGEFSRIGKLGIDGMQTRARLVGGTFDIQSEPGRGTTLTVTIPT